MYVVVLYVITLNLYICQLHKWLNLKKSGKSIQYTQSLPTTHSAHDEWHTSWLLKSKPNNDICRSVWITLLSLTDARGWLCFILFRVIIFYERRDVSKTYNTNTAMPLGSAMIAPLLEVTRDHFVNVSSQWETTLQCNVVSHWLGAYTKWSLK